MKLKYNHNGETESIPLSKKKPEGKRLAIRHDEQIFYAPLVDAGDATASNMHTVFKGEMLAVRQMPAPEIENILIAPPRVSVMQGQSATATVSAEGNEAVAGLSFSIANNPTWITIADECILIQPSDNDLGEAIVEVIAKDTGSDASASAAFIAEALLCPIITQLGIAPPAVTVAQGSTSTAIIHAEANSAVGGLSYSLDGAPSWITNDNDTIWVEPTTNDIGTANVQVVAYDPNSSARADTSFTAEAVMVPAIYGITASPTNITVEQGDSTVVALAAEYNSAVTGIEYSLEGAPPWITLEGNLITVAPTTSDLGSVTVVVTARDTGSGVQATTQITAEAQVVQPKISGITVQPANGIKGSRVVAWQKNTLNYPLTCTANSAVTSVKYSLAPSENNPPWLSVYINKTLRAAPTTANSALGDTATVTLVAYDTGSTAQATTAVAVNVIERPSIGAISFSEKDVTGYPEKAATITISAPNANSGVEGLEYSLSAQPDWVTLQGNKIIAAPATGETGYQVISVQAVDTGSTIVSTSRCSVRASVCPELTAIKAKAMKVSFRDAPVTLNPTLSKSGAATYGIKYAVQDDHGWMSINSSTGKITLQVPDSEPFSSDSVTGSYTVSAINPAKTSSVSVADTFIADTREVDRPQQEYKLIGNGDTITQSTYPNITIDGATTNYTVLANLIYKYPIPHGEFSVGGVFHNFALNAWYASSLPITIEANATRTFFTVKGIFTKRAANTAEKNSYQIFVYHPSGTLYKRQFCPIINVYTSLEAYYDVAAKTI